MIVSDLSEIIKGPVFLLPRLYEIDVRSISLFRQQEIRDELSDYKFIDRDNRVWQGYFFINKVPPGERGLTGKKGKEEVLFLFKCQGDYVSEYDPDVLCSGVEWVAPYHIFVTREQYILVNTGIYGVVFDAEKEGRNHVVAKVREIIEVLSGLSTTEIILEIEKTININSPFRKYYNKKSEEEGEKVTDLVRPEDKREVWLNSLDIMGNTSFAEGVSYSRSWEEEKASFYGYRKDPYVPEKVQSTLKCMGSVILKYMPIQTSIVNAYAEISEKSHTLIRFPVIN